MNNQPFGEQLRHWRSWRGWSQLELGLEAEVSTRHISFMESGRARPSREMVLRLAGALELPLREQNLLLEAAGFAAVYGDRSLYDTDLSEALGMLRFLLEAHQPYPAFVLDRYWNVLEWNRPQAWLLQGLAASDGSPAGINALDLVFQPGPIRESMENWHEVARAVLRRLRRQIVRAAGDDGLQEAWQKALQAPGVSALLPLLPESRPPAMVPIRTRTGDLRLTWFNTLSVFGAVGDAGLEDLVIESFFPGDAATRSFVEETWKLLS